MKTEILETKENKKTVDELENGDVIKVNESENLYLVINADGVKSKNCVEDNAFLYLEDSSCQEASDDTSFGVLEAVGDDYEEIEEGNWKFVGRIDTITISPVSTSD